MAPVGFNFFIATATATVEIKGVGILKAIKFQLTSGINRIKLLAC